MMMIPVSDAAATGSRQSLAGRPFGTGLERQLGPLGRNVDVSPHNYHVTVFLRVGVLGLAAALWLYGFALRGTDLAARQGHLEGSVLGPDIVHVAIAVKLVYFIPYPTQTEHGLLLGLAVAVASQASLDRSTETRAVGVSG